MATRKPKNALLTNEATQTVGLGGLALAFVSIMLIGGLFVGLGLVLALGCCALVVVLHWRELCAAIASRRLTSHGVLPLAVVVFVPSLAVLVAFKEPILKLGQKAQAPPQLVAAAILKISNIEFQIPKPGQRAAVNFTLDNTGTAPATQLRHRTYMRELRSELSGGDIDQLFGAMAASLSAISESSKSSEYPPSKGRYFYSIVGTEFPELAPDSASWKRQAAGKSRIYVATMYQYRYPLLPEGAWATGERCFFMFQSVYHVCPTHNSDRIPMAALSPPSVPN